LLCRGATVDEVLYPLAVGKQASHFADVVDDLMSMDPEGANVRVSKYTISHMTTTVTLQQDG
jgi:hypothetical protein